jgi:hypothetical protein
MKQSYYLLLSFILFSLIFIGSVRASTTDTIGATDGTTNFDGYVNWYKITASASGDLETLGINIGTTGSGHVRLALYSGNATTPQNLLVETGSTALNVGWNDISATGVSIVTSTVYWLSYQQDSGAVKVQYSSSVDTRWYFTSAYTTFPNPALPEASQNNYIPNLRMVYSSGLPSSIALSASPSFSFQYPALSVVSCARIVGSTSQTLTLYRNGTNVASGTSSPQSDIQASLDAGAYNYTCTISAGGGYTANITKQDLIITPSSSAVTVIPTPSYTFGAGTSSKVYCQRLIGDNLMTLYRNGTVKAYSTSGATSVISENTTLPAGTYNYTCTMNASINYLASSEQATINVIPLESPSIAISVSPSVSFGYGTQSTVSCARVIGDSNSILTLYRDNVIVSTGTSSPQSETTILNGGVYNYTCYISSSGSYSDKWTNQNITVNKLTPSISISASPSSISCENTQTTVSCARITGNSNSILTLYRDGIAISTGTTSPQYETATLPINDYYYTCSISETNDYSSLTTSQLITITSAETPSLTYMINMNLTKDDNTWVDYECIPPSCHVTDTLAAGRAGSGPYNSYLRFKLMNGLPFIPTSILNANLCVYATTINYAVGGNMILNAYEVNDTAANSAWQQDTLSWANQPCYYASFGGFGAKCNVSSWDLDQFTESQVNITSIEKWFCFDVTQYAQRGLLRNDKSFTVIISNLTSHALNINANAYFASSRNGSTYSPRLNITFIPTNVFCGYNATQPVNENIPQNMTAGTYQYKFTNTIISSQGFVLLLLTFISAISCYFLNEEFTLYITSALTFLFGIILFFPLWIGVLGAIFGIIVAILTGKSSNIEIGR